MRPRLHTLCLMLLPLALSAQTEVEPNGDFTQANVWAEGATITGTSCFDGSIDVDWFRVTPSDQGVITVTATVYNNTTSTYGVAIQFYEKDGVTLHWNTGAPSTPTPLTTQTVNYCSGDDTLYVRVSTQLDHCEYYTLSYVVTPPVFASDVEDNDELASAAPLPQSTWSEGRLSFAFDDGVDWYSVQSPEVGRYELSVEAAYQTDGTTEGQITTQLYDGNGSLVANQGVQVGANSVISSERTYSCLGAATYYLKMAFSSVCGVAYRIKWELVPTVFHADAEPNNTAQQATYFPPDVPQQGVPGDTDWWKLFKPYTGDLQLGVSAAYIDAGTNDFTVQVYNTALQLIDNGAITPGQNNVPSDLLITVPATDADSFYVSIYNNGYDCGSYQLAYASTYVGIAEEHQAPTISVSPNPSTQRFELRFANTQQNTIRITDMEGRAVLEENISGRSFYTWDASHIGPGNYVACITRADGSTSTVRLVRIP